MITFNDNSGAAASGTYNPTDTFSVDVFASWNAYDSSGFSYWLEAPLALAPNIVVTSAIPFTFLSGGHLTPTSFNSTQSADPGYMHETPDLGAIAPGETFPPATYHVTTITFSLGAAAPGTYVLKTTHIGGRISEIGDTDFLSHPLVAQGAYTITVIPEPATWSLIGLGALGTAGISWLFARRKKV